MTGEDRIKNAKDGFVTWERVQALAAKLSKSGISHRLMFSVITNIHFNVYSDMGEANNLEKIIFSWIDPRDHQSKEKRITQEGFFGLIADLLEAGKAYRARLLIFSLDEGLTDNDIGKVAQARFNIMTDPLFIKVKERVSILRNGRYMMSEESLPPLSFILPYTYIGKGQIDNIISLGWRDPRSGKDIWFNFQPGRLKTMIADLYEYDPLLARKFIASLFKIPEQQQIKSDEDGFFVLSTDAQKTLLDKWSRWLVQKEKGFLIPPDLGEEIRGHLEAVFHYDSFGSFNTQGMMYYQDPVKKGYWEFTGKLGELCLQLMSHKDTFIKLKKTIENDRAMAGTIIKPQVEGGIDLNTTNGMQWKINKQGLGVEMNVDQAMIERIRLEGIDSLSPVILRMTPVASIWSLVGLPKK